MTLTDNPRAVAGDNLATDYAKQVTERLTDEYNALVENVSAALDEARKLPATVDDEPTASMFTEVISRLRALRKRVDGIREAEKEPHLTSERAIDSFFFTLMEKLERRKKTDRVGAIDVLHERLNKYNLRRLEEERKRRDEELRIRREEEERAAEARRKAEEAEREALAKAARARKQESIDATSKAAAEAAARASEAAEAAAKAAEDRREAAAQASAKSADLVRERHDSGSLNTMRQVGYAEIIDSSKLDAIALFPFIKEDAKASALRLWAKTTQYRKQMEGAAIGFRDETIVR